MDDVKLENINLAQEALGASICCDHDSSELTPITNIIKGKEWMVDSFIRPPVLIKIHLPIPIKLSKICFNSRVGTQSSSLFDVMISWEPKLLSKEGESWHTKNNCEESKTNLKKSIIEVGCGSPYSNGHVEFINRRMAQEQDFPPSLPPPAAPGWLGMGNRLGSAKTWWLLNSVTAVFIRIRRTISNTVPCLKNLQIFGESTGDRNYKEQEKLLLEKFKKLSSPAHPQSVSFSFFGGESGSLYENVPDPECINLSDDDNVTSSSSSSSKSSLDDEIPSDFLDSITHSMMLIPMTLPSGHNVDRSTVDKCQDMFATWGGKPRDPFTGKLFTSNYQPVFNAALKSRIDRFRMSTKFKETSSTSANIGQTLGDSQMIQNFLRKQSENPQRKRNAEEICDKTNKKVFTGNLITGNASDDDDDNNSDINVALSRSLSQVQKITK